MTGTVGHAAQSQNMVETITQSAKVGGKAHKMSGKASQEADEADSSDRGGVDHTANGPAASDDATEHKPVAKSGKTAGRSHHEGHKKDDKDKSFADTIDKLGTQSQSTPAPANPAAAALPAGWTADLVFRQTSAGHAQADASPATTAVLNSGKTARPGNLLKQDSIIALLDTRQRLLSAHDAQDMASSTNSDANDTTVATPITVQSRQSHWVFGDAANSSNPRVFETLMAKDGKASPALASAPASMSAEAKDVATKSIADSATPVQASHVGATHDASLRQAFDGQQGSAGNGREQMPSGNAGDKRNSDIKASSSVEHEPVDATKLPGGMSGATQQVKNGVLNALTGDKGSTPQTSAPQLPQDRPVIPGQVLRSIDLTLSPPDLGTVRLKLSLKSNALDIDAEASKASTAKLLDDDRKSLEQSLRDAGYDVKNLKIADASGSNNANWNSSQNGAGSSFQDGSQARMNFAGRQDNGNMQRREGALPDQSQQQQRSPRDNNPKASPSSESASGRQSNAIYI
jgi:hypothetical protein